MSQLPDFLFDRVSAEIHQQMDGVRAFADRLSRQPTAAEFAAFADGVNETAACVQRILSRASDLRAADTGNLALSPAPFRLRDLMDDLESDWRRRVNDGAVTLLVAYEGDPDACAAIDGARLIQLFDGLIGQAAASVRRGAVEASLRIVTVDDAVKIEGRVRSGGARGDFDSADVQEIEARYGLETALGVALSRRILQVMGGTMRREANTGVGETMVFELEAPAIHAVEATSESASGDTPAAHILVVDDNATNRMVAQTLCEMFECTSETAEDGLAAVEAARSGRFDLILMDIKMPRMDGIAATKIIRGLTGRIGRVPIIALTANADPEDAKAYVAAGMNGVVEKPMKPETLLSALRQALSKADEAEAAAA